MTLPEILERVVLGLLCYAAVVCPLIAWFHLHRNRDPWELPPGERTVTPMDWRARTP